MPLNEYEKKQESPKGTPVTIKILSTQREVIGTSLFDNSARGKNDSDTASDDSQLSDITGSYKLITEGELEFSDTVTVRYREEDTPDGIGGITEISFLKSSPGSITVTRTGGVTSVFLIEERRRQISVYNTPFGSTEICTYGKRVDNKITAEGGTLILDYAVELHGMTTQKTKMKLEVKVKK